MTEDRFSPQAVLEFWFPDTGHQDSADSHAAFWMERMQGGMDAAIDERFAELTLAAATGQLDHWKETPRGRLALLIALDQFPRSLWRGTPAAYAQDIKAARLALEGMANGHYGDLEFWEQAFYAIALGHCEGPDHLERMTLLDDVTEGIVERIPDHLEAMKERFRAQQARVKAVIATFGRHPHRNEILRRPSTPEEDVYIAAGDFPHNNRPDGGDGKV